MKYLMVSSLKDVIVGKIVFDNLACLRTMPMCCVRVCVYVFALVVHFICHKFVHIIIFH